MTAAQIRSLAIFIVCLLCGVLADSASAQSQTSGIYYAFCASVTYQRAAGGPARYFSGIFLIDTGPYYAETHRSSLDQSAPFVFPWVRQFDQFIAQTYPSTEKGGSECRSSNTLEEAQKMLDGVMQSDEKNNGIKVVGTGWKYATNPPIVPPAPQNHSVAAAPVAPATVAPAHPAAPPPVAHTVSPAPVAPPQNIPATHVAAAPVAPAPKATSYAVCWAEVPTLRTAYFSAPFAVEGSDFLASRTEYRNFLTMKYGRVGQFNCRELRSLAEAKQQAQTWMDSAHAKDKIIDTGWKYQ